MGSTVPLLRPSGADVQAPLAAQNPAEVTGTGGPPIPETQQDTELPSTAILLQMHRPVTRAETWAAMISSRLDLYIYTLLFFFVGLPVFFASGYAMPVQVTLNVLAYFGALALPAPWRRIMHPAIVSSVLTIVGIYVLSMIRGQEFDVGLRHYRTNTKYQQLFAGKTDLPKPGAGDVLSSVLDVSIVALALPMYQHRHELKRSFLPMIIPTVAIAIGSLFGYPPLCHALGISPSRSLSFPARSLTLALAGPATQNLGGDQALIAVLAILSGILGVIIGPQLLSILRIPEDDYITRGVTMGSSSSAIATALLLVTDPRAAAFSSLAMGLFGTITVGFTSVPAIAHVVQQLAGK